MQQTFAHIASSPDYFARGRRLAAMLAVTAVCATLNMATISPATAQTVAVVDVVKVAEGFRASKLVGTKVLNSTNEEVGTLDDLIFDKDRLVFAILQVGGFLGIGGYLVAVPYDTLEISDGGRKIVMTSGGSKEELQKTQQFNYGKDQK